MIRLCKLRNITEYIYKKRKNEISIGVTPAVLLIKILCMPIHSLHHTVYFFKLYIISMA